MFVEWRSASESRFAPSSIAYLFWLGRARFCASSPSLETSDSATCARYCRIESALATAEPVHDLTFERKKSMTTKSEVHIRIPVVLIAVSIGLFAAFLRQLPDATVPNDATSGQHSKLTGREDVGNIDKNHLPPPVSPSLQEGFLR